MGMETAVANRPNCAQVGTGKYGGDGDFSVYMPVRPSFYVKERYFQDGVKVSRALIGGAYYKGVVFIARVYEVPEPKQLSNDKLSSDCPKLADLRKAEGLDIERNGFKGKEYLKQADSYTHVIQCFVTNRRFYVIEAAARDKDNASVKRFLSSLSLGGAKATDGKSDDTALSQTSPSMGIDTSKLYNENEARIRLS
jgi:hypothetical protein